MGLHMVTTSCTTTMDATFNYVVNTLMCIKTRHHTSKVLHEYDMTSANDIISINDKTLDSLVADGVDDKNNVIIKDKPIPTYNKLMIPIFGNFCQIKKAGNGGKLTVKDILRLDIEEWNEYRVESQMPKQGRSFPATNISTNTSVPNEVMEYRNCSKQDC
jgi:hypothetical protein